MKPVAIFRHVAYEGPGYLHEILDRNSIDYELIAIDNHQPIPKTPERYSALIFLGGPMSVNDPLDWVQQEVELIRSAHASGIPLLGICLGAQLIAKALGARVIKNKSPEIGWFPITAARGNGNQSELGDIPSTFTAFHWHGETFDIPEGATPLWHSEACANQGFKIGNTLALQFHVEVTEEMIEAWISEYAPEFSQAQTWVQPRAMIRRDTPTYLPLLRQAAEALITPWLEPLQKFQANSPSVPRR